MVADDSDSDESDSVSEAVPRGSISGGQRMSRKLSRKLSVALNGRFSRRLGSLIDENGNEIELDVLEMAYAHHKSCLDEMEDNFKHSPLSQPILARLEMLDLKKQVNELKEQIDRLKAEQASSSSSSDNDDNNSDSENEHSINIEGSDQDGNRASIQSLTSNSKRDSTASMMSTSSKTHSKKVDRKDSFLNSKKEGGKKRGSLLNVVKEGDEDADDVEVGNELEDLDKQGNIFFFHNIFFY